MFGSGHCWAIILAGGEGERMRDAITSWLGRHQPKQYCTFVGTRSMLQHTIDRARQLVSEERIVTIIDRSHRRFLDSEGAHSIPGRVLEQPRQLDTGPGILLPATYILAQDPKATVLILPSDHYVYPEERFLSRVREAVILAEWKRDRLILLGAKPDRAESDYGWIRAGMNLRSWTHGSEVTKIQAFLEKPSAKAAGQFLTDDTYFWNTMILVVKIGCLWSLAQRFLPETAKRLEILRLLWEGVGTGWIGPKFEQALLEEVYQALERANFSRRLLERATKQILLLPMTDVEWSDWGRPARIAESLAALGKSSLMPLEPEITASKMGPEEARVVG
jgi:mannose-1-phosphate guanylyltransferase